MQNRNRRSFLFICIVVILVGCDKPRLRELGSSDVVVAFGDSLTAGLGVSQDYSYPSVLSELTGFKIVNSGVSGETTEEGLKRLPTVIEEHNPSLILLIEGGNDILRNKNYQHIEQNLGAMIQLARDRDIEVVLVGVPEKKLFSNAAPFYKELAEKYDLPYEPKLIGRIMRSPSMKSDTVHFNKVGYKEMAKGIYDLLSENGAF